MKSKRLFSLQKKKKIKENSLSNIPQTKFLKNILIGDENVEIIKSELNFGDSTLNIDFVWKEKKYQLFFWNLPKLNQRIRGLIGPPHINSKSVIICFDAKKREQEFENLFSQLNILQEKEKMLLFILFENKCEMNEKKRKIVQNHTNLFQKNFEFDNFGDSKKHFRNIFLKIIEFHEGIKLIDSLWFPDKQINEKWGNSFQKNVYILLLLKKTHPLLSLLPKPLLFLIITCLSEIYFYHHSSFSSTHSFFTQPSLSHLPF